MEHLRSQFLDDLDEDVNTYVEDGRIHICAHHWSPGDILEGMLAKSAFEATFQNWLQERSEQQALTADEILTDFELEDRFSILSEAYARGFVTPFIGAGLSIPSGYPGWTSFLRRLRRQTTVAETIFEALLTSGQYEEAAEVLAADLGPAFNEAIESSFGCTRDLDGAIQFVPYVFDGPVLTTNFDEVVKRSYDQANRSFEETLSATESDEIPRALAAGRSILIKLHGTSRMGQGRVLTRSEYETHYGEGESLQRFIRTICNRTLLFLGCSLSVDRTLGVMRDYVQTEGHDNVARHYAFLEDPGTDELRANRRNQLAECNIYPIWYPKNEHDTSIEALLTKLKDSSE